MIKKLLPVLFALFVTTAVVAQSKQVKGIIKDVTTNEVISSVTVSTQDQRHITISNDEGAFSLSYPDGTEKIILSHLSYNTYEIALSSVPQDGIYWMEPSELILDEVITYNTPINELLQELVTQSQNKLDAPILLNTYYREFVKINDRYTKFADGLVDYSVLKDKKKIKTQTQVKQSRAAKLENPEEEALDAVTGLDVRKAVVNDYFYNAIQRPLLNDKAYLKYDFIIKSQKDSEGRQLEVINFTPKENLQEALYSGKIVYDPATKLIMNIEIGTVPSLMKYAKVHNFLIIKASIEELIYSSAFKIVDGKYMLSYSSRDGSIHIWNKKKYDEILKFKSDLVVTGYSNNVPDVNRKEKYKEKSLYENGNNYTEKFWLKNNSIVLTQQEENIIKSLDNTGQQ